jgi:hypothetical protein
MPWHAAAELTEARLGKPLFSEQTEWHEADQHAAGLLEVFRKLKSF